MSNANLTDMQQRFVDALLTDPDMTPQEAYLKAGYAESGLKSQPYELLRNPRIMKALDAEMAKRSTQTRITKDRVLREIASMAFSSVDDYEVHSDGSITLRDGADYRAMKAIQSVEIDRTTDKNGDVKTKVKFKLWDKSKAVDQLAKHLNLFKEHQEAGAVHIPSQTPERDAALLEHFGGKDNED